MLSDLIEDRTERDALRTFEERTAARRDVLSTCEFLVDPDFPRVPLAEAVDCWKVIRGAAEAYAVEVWGAGCSGLGLDHVRAIVREADEALARMAADAVRGGNLPSRIEW